MCVHLTYQTTVKYKLLSRSWVLIVDGHDDFVEGDLEVAIECIINDGIGQGIKVAQPLEEQNQIPLMMNALAELQVAQWDHQITDPKGQPTDHEAQDHYKNDANQAVLSRQMNFKRLGLHRVCLRWLGAATTKMYNG